MNSASPDLTQWTVIKDRGALRKTGCVYRSPDGTQILRTGEVETIASEASFANESFGRGFPVPRVIGSGVLPEGTGFFIEESAGMQNYGHILRTNTGADGVVNEAAFSKFTNTILPFFRAQLDPSNRQPPPSGLRGGIQIENVFEENPTLDRNQFNEAISKAEERLAGVPLVLSHGDLTPYNVMEGGIIDFEHRFVAPFGYDTVTAVTFQRFWDHPGPDGSGTMKQYDFSERQLALYLADVDALCAESGIAPLSELYDDHLMLKSIWALCYERPDDLEDSRRVARWKWRRNVALHCVEEFLSNSPIDSRSFFKIGLGESA